MRANRDAFGRYEFSPRVLRDVSTVDTSSTLLGAPVPFPLVLAPTGYTRIADPQGELAVARAAQRAGVPYTLSTMATRSIEEVAAASGDGRRWFQVYVWRDRALVRDMVERAAAAGYEALVITVDTANLGRRERDVRRGLHAAAEARPRHDPRRHHPPRLDVALCPLRADPVRQRRDVEGRRQPVRRIAPDRPRREGVVAVRPGAVVGRHRVVPLDLERGDRAQGRAVGGRRPPRRRARHRGDRPVQPRRPPARQRAGDPRTRRPRRRRSWWAHRDHLRRRGAAGE